MTLPADPTAQPTVGQSPDPSLDVHLTLAKDRIVFRIRPALQLEQWMFVIDLGTEFAVQTGVFSLDRALLLKNRLEGEAVDLRRQGWVDVG